MLAESSGSSGLCDPVPAQRPQVGVRLDLAGTEQLGQPTGGDVAADVHLVEPVLSLDETLGLEQVLGIVGVDLDHPVRVAQHVHPAVEAGKADLPVGDREGSADGGDGQSRESRCGDQHQDEREDHPSRNAPHRPSLRGRHPRVRVSVRPAATTAAGPTIPACGLAVAMLEC